MASILVFDVDGIVCGALVRHSGVVDGDVSLAPRHPVTIALHWVDGSGQRQEEEEKEEDQDVQEEQPS